MRRELVSAIKGAMLGVFIGDALGRPFEGCPYPDHSLRDKVRRRSMLPSIWLYSDDTEMMISVAEWVLNSNRDSSNSLLTYLAKNHDPARGYGKGMNAIIREFKQSSDKRIFAETMWAEGSKGNGGTVRIAPIVCRYIHSETQCLEYVDRSVRTTHSHPDAIASARLYAMFLWWVINHNCELTPNTVIDRLIQCRTYMTPNLQAKIDTLMELIVNAQGAEQAVGKLGNGVLAEQSVPLAIYGFVAWCKDFETVVINTITMGGDADTIAAMAGSLAGAWFGVDKIPVQWVANLENRVRGKDEVLGLAERIYQQTTEET